MPSALHALHGIALATLHMADEATANGSPGEEQVCIMVLGEALLGMALHARCISEAAEHAVPDNMRIRLHC